MSVGETREQVIPHLPPTHPPLGKPPTASTHPLSQPPSASAKGSCHLPTPSPVRPAAHPLTLTIVAREEAAAPRVQVPGTEAEITPPPKTAHRFRNIWTVPKGDAGPVPLRLPRFRVFLLHRVNRRGEKIPAAPAPHFPRATSSHCTVFLSTPPPPLASQLVRPSLPYSIYGNKNEVGEPEKNPANEEKRNRTR